MYKTCRFLASSQAVSPPARSLPGGDRLTLKSPRVSAVDKERPLPPFHLFGSWEGHDGRLATWRATRQATWGVGNVPDAFAIIRPFPRSPITTRSSDSHRALRLAAALLEFGEGSRQSRLRRHPHGRLEHLGCVRWDWDDLGRVFAASLFPRLLVVLCQHGPEGQHAMYEVDVPAGTTADSPQVFLAYLAFLRRSFWDSG